MSRRPFKQKPIQTYVEIGGTEYEVSCFYDYQPEEADTNTAAGLEITSAYFEDKGCLLDKLSDDERERLEHRVLEAILPDDDGYGDWLYDQRKDALAEERR